MPVIGRGDPSDLAGRSVGWPASVLVIAFRDDRGGEDVSQDIFVYLWRSVACIRHPTIGASFHASGYHVG